MERTWERTWETRHTAETAAAPREVWARWADAARWSEWDSGVGEAHLEGPFVSGTTALVRFRHGPRLRFLITELEPERIFTDEAHLPLAWLVHEHRIEPRPEGCRLHHRISLRGPLAPLYGLVAGRRLRAGLAASVERLARQTTAAAAPVMLA
jgi:hypothetical protein